MSNVRGRIAVDVQFTDSTSSEGVQSLKTITMQDATEYTMGKVAIASGTVGTAAQTLPLSSYLNASGAQVNFSQASRVAFQCVGAEGQFLLSATPVLFFGAVSNGNAAVSDIPASFSSTSGYRVRTASGTATYTLVLYGT